MNRSARAIVIVIAALVISACASTPTSGSGASVAPGGPVASVAPAPPARRPPIPSNGCGTSKVGALDKERQVVAAGGPDRFYLLTTPGSHDGKTPLPLVLDFHGLLEGAGIHAEMTRFTDVAQKEGFVVAFPNGSGVPVRWNVSVDLATNPDLQYFDAMVTKLKDDLCIDESRIYSTGLSYGAIMTSFLMCNRAEVFAATAPVDGVLPPNDCRATKKLPLLAFHGTADPLLPFNGGLGAGVPGLLQGKLPDGATTTTAPATYDLEGDGYPKAMREWAARNGCNPTPTDTKVTATVLRRVYTCPTGLDVEFVVVIGGGHAWPGSEFSKSIEKIVGHTTFDINASEEIWKFFKRFPKP